MAWKKNCTDVAIVKMRGTFAAFTLISKLKFAAIVALLIIHAANVQTNLRKAFVVKHITVNDEVFIIFLLVKDLMYELMSIFISWWGRNTWRVSNVRTYSWGVPCGKSRPIIDPLRTLWRRYFYGRKWPLLDKASLLLNTSFQQGCQTNCLFGSIGYR